MNKLSTGEDATLKSYRDMMVALLGEDNPAVHFLDKKIEKSPNGENEEVLTDEGQMLHLLMSMGVSHGQKRT